MWPKESSKRFLVGMKRYVLETLLLSSKKLADELAIYIGVLVQMTLAKDAC